MINYERHQKPKKSWLQGPSSELSQAYHELSLRLEEVERRLTELEDPRLKICLTVLEEDLSSLLEECEDYLVIGTPEAKKQYLSFLSRSDTILEEVEKLVTY